MLCPNCASTVADSANFCPNCGTNVIPMKNATSPYDTSGGAQQAYATQQAYAPQAEEKSAFERGYQQGYEWATGSAAAKQTAQQAAEANAYQQAQQQYSYAPPASPYAQTAYSSTGQVGTKSKIAAGLLAIFLGALGIHKFYLGYNTQGVIMLLVTLLTFGIGAFVMEIIAIIEGIMYLVKSDTEFYYTYELGDKPWF